MPVPQLATARITDRIQALDGRESLPPFEIKSIERDIERLKSVSAAEAYMLFGMLSSALGDYESSKESHEKSIRLAMGEVGFVNYGISMRKLGRFKEAKVYFLKALERSPGSVSILDKIVRTSIFLCDFEDFEEIIARFIKANPESLIEDMQYMKTAKSIISHLERLEISRSEFKLVGEFIEQAMNESGLVGEVMDERLSNFDGVQHIYLEIPLAVKSAHQLVVINDRIAELVLGCDEIQSWDKLVVNFVDKRIAPLSVVA